MYGNNFYFGLTKKYVVLFGTLFNDITISRLTQKIKVPITYSSQDKMLARVFSDPDTGRKVATITPAMSFVMEAPEYDSDRKLQSTLKRCITEADGSITQQFVGVPYNIPFTLYIYSREEEDGLRILENILPYFTPSLSVSVNLVEGSNSVDVPIILNSIDFENNSYGDMMERRKLIWTLKFTMKAEFFGPRDSNKKIIRIIHANFRDTTSRDILEETHIEPGLTIDGKPTSVRLESIDVNLITATDDFGFIIETKEGPEPHP